MHRYSEEDLARVERIRQLQTLLGLNLDEVAAVLRSEDRLAEIRRACQDGGTSDAERLGMARESLRLLQDLRATVQAKQRAIDGFLADLDARIGRSADWLHASRRILSHGNGAQSPRSVRNDGFSFLRCG